MKLPLTIAISTAISTLLVAGSPSAQIYVPGDYSTLGEAVTAAEPGATIIVTTPVLQDPIVLDKPLRILGDPVLNVGTEDLCHGSPQPGACVCYLRDKTDGTSATCTVEPKARISPTFEVSR